MGFEDRDYVRNSPGYTDQFGSWGNLAAVPPVVKYLVAANIAVFVLQIFFVRPMTPDEMRAYYAPYVDEIGETEPAADGGAADEKTGEDAASDETAGENDAPTMQSDRKPQAGATGEGEMELPDADYFPKVSIVQKWLELDARKVLRGQIWRLLTCAFCHDRLSVFHILFNMLFLWWFGITLERMYGSREFLLFYIAAALVASLAYVGLELATGSNIPAIGASGAVMGVTMLYACFYPRHTIRILFLIPVEIRWIVLFYVIFDLHPVLLALAGDPQYTGVADAAHLGGLAFGFVYWKTSLRLEPYWDALTRLRLPGGRRLRVYREPPAQYQRRPRRPAADDQVDQILQKISEQGLDSLTDQERRALEDASRRYKGQ